MYVILLHSGHEHVSATHVVTLQIEGASFSITPVTTDQSPPHHIPEDWNLETCFCMQYKIFLSPDEKGTKWRIFEYAMGV